MEMHQVRYFVALCETLNFTRAAAACHVAQPSLTKAIRKLEDELGGPLFSRERGLTHLTDLGRLMRPHLEAMLDASEAARAAAEGFRTLDRANLRIGAMCTIGPTRLIGFFKSFRARVPSATLNIHDAPGTRLAEMLLAGDLDAALIALPKYPERFETQPLYDERYVVAFRPGHRFEAMDRVPLRELNAEDYLNRVNCEYPEYFAALGIPDPAADCRVRYETEREDWIQAMILAGLGCCVTPEFLPMIPGVATRPLVEPEISRTVVLATVAGRRHSPALRAFVALARRHDWN
ncbi:Transcriptional regulator, LysR family [uncultured Alphaproteobacteria bacterium]|uniref:Transcriptional regulator, LysR family n=1 Tax=uncultured Alphaproteobacteria bacterium TaxID=91750 RepID=A0A212JCJ8_9PROT|nr:Transcriptional regulator, LysR family [uncultured Alphaproteobacteria bacterium]